MSASGGSQSVKDTRLASRAIREGWKVPPEAKAEVVKACHELVKSRDPRSMLFAAKVLIDADKIDQADEHLAEKHRRLDSGQATEVNEIVVRHERKPLAEHGPD